MKRSEKAVIGARVKAMRNRSGTIERFVEGDNELAERRLQDRLASAEKYLRERRRAETQRRA